MALSNIVRNEGQTTVTPAPAEKVAKKSSGTDAFRAEGAKIRQTMSADERAIEGSKSDKIAFVNALGNPARKQDRVEGGKSIPCYEVVGYTFKALEDVEVPVLPLQSSDPFNTTVAEPKHVKAGETFTCNIMEMASLISRPEYAGKFSGEGDIITLSAKANKTRPTPLPILKRAVGSIKTEMDLVAEMVDENGKKIAKVKPEYEEKFAIIFKKKSASASGVKKTHKAGESAADLAAAFRNILASKQQ